MNNFLSLIGQSFAVPFRWLVLIFFFFGYQSYLNAQCGNKITVFNGVQSFSCTEVTVSSSGDAGTGLPCGTAGGYWISWNDEGSITFSFSTPATGVTLEFDAINSLEHNNQGHEEPSIEINGAPYPFPDAGSPNCKPLQAIVTPGGNLMAPNCPAPGPNGCIAGCQQITIMEIINTITVKDLIIAGSNVFGGVDFSIYFCCLNCSVDAGQLTQQTLSLCAGESAVMLPSSNPQLNPTSILQYVLYSNAADPAGSILVTSNTPEFDFDPAIIQTGVTYYIAAIAGENLAGNVNLNDPCLDFSNEVEVVWWPRPAVDFAVAEPDICPGACATIEATFTGEPPFTLVYQSSFSGPVTRSFTDTQGSFTLCAPANAPAGNLQLNAIQLSDAHCACP